MDVQQGRELEDAYYTHLFLETSYWSTPYPNPDEAARWGKIVTYVSRIVYRRGNDRPLRMLDLGCGRGWLAHLLADFGQIEGVDPVPEVIEAGTQLFPGLNLSVGTAETILNRPDFTPYALVVTSEVIEHIPAEEKQGFLKAIYRLLAPEGHLILTTPRGELWHSVEKHAKSRGSELQPIEDWLKEEELAHLFSQSGFRVREHIRAFPIPRGGRMTWRLWRSAKLANLLKKLGLESVRATMAYSLCKYQVWWVQKL